jgi:acyl carrier protein
MTEQEMIIARTNEVFVESFEIEEELLQPQMHLFDDLDLDSLDIVDLVVALQQKFGVQIRNEERIKEIRTLGDIYSFILSLQRDGDIFVEDKKRQNSP